MSQTSTLTYAVGNGGPKLSGSVVDTATSLTSFDQTFAAASSNVNASLAFVRANVNQLILLADQPCTVKTNSSGSPADTIALIANAPFVWSRSNGYFAIPFSADVTTIYVTCTPTCRLRIQILTN